MNSIKRKIKLILMNKAGSLFIPSKIRMWIYKKCGMEIEEGAFIYNHCLFNNANVNIRVGKGTFINHKSVFENKGRIEIGDNCTIGMEVLFCAVTHEVCSEESRAGKAIGNPIKIENGCWIGSRTTILDGVNIGRGCVIGAGALVNKDCEPNGLYVGVPAKRIKNLL